MILNNQTESCLIQLFNFYSVILRVKSNFSNNVKVANKLVKPIVRTYSIVLQNVTVWLGIDYTNLLNLPHKSSHFFRYSELISLQSGIIHFFSAEISCALSPCFWQNVSSRKHLN